MIPENWIILLNSNIIFFFKYMKYMKSLNNINYKYNMKIYIFSKLLFIVLLLKNKIEVQETVFQIYYKPLFLKNKSNTVYLSSTNFFILI